MALSEMQRAQVTKRLGAFCAVRVPAAARDQVRLTFQITGSEVTLFEERPAYLAPNKWERSPIAKFKYVGTQRLWRLYCQRRDLRWHVYDDLPTAASFNQLLDEVAEDPTGIFWG